MENNQHTESSSLLKGVKESVTVKLAVIVFLILILLLLTSMINSIVKDRQKRRQEVISEIQDKWGGQQQITGPILTLYAEYADTSNGVSNKYINTLHILPEDLKINGEVQPEIRKRSLYEVAVYNSQLKLKGHFDPSAYLPSKNLLGIRKAFLSTGLNDMRGINDKVKYRLDGRELQIQSGLLNDHSGITDLSGLIKLENIDWDKPMFFDIQFHLRGSDEIAFVPVGKNTEVNLKSPWPDPGFSGYLLPNQSDINSSGFSAEWKINPLNRVLPPVWKSKIHWHKFSSQAFGVKMIRPANDYQKITRLIKYAILAIALTFLTFLLLEVIKKWHIHPFQYTLVGLALCLFYILLVAVTEHTNFNYAYWICAAVIVLLIGFYSAAVFKQRRWSVVLSFLLMGGYSFLFVTLQLKGYALLMGSIGLVVMLAVTMYLTRNIDWYGIGKQKNGKLADPEPEKGEF